MVDRIATPRSDFEQKMIDKLRRSGRKATIFGAHKPSGTVTVIARPVIDSYSPICVSLKPDDAEALIEDMQKALAELRSVAS